MKTIVALVIVLFLSGHCPAQESNTDFWLTFEQLEDSLRVNPKPVFLYFHTDWCTYCRKMEKRCLKNRVLRTAIRCICTRSSLMPNTTGDVDFDGQVFSNRQLKTSRTSLHDLAVCSMGKTTLCPAT
jgi:thioredoxin-related protein